jgi:hypothetical protein
MIIYKVTGPPKSWHDTDNVTYHAGELDAREHFKRLVEDMEEEKAWVHTNLVGWRNTLTGETRKDHEPTPGRKFVEHTATLDGVEVARGMAGAVLAEALLNNRAWSRGITGLEEYPPIQAPVNALPSVDVALTKPMRGHCTDHRHIKRKKQTKRSQQKD